MKSPAGGQLFAKARCLSRTRQNRRVGCDLLCWSKPNRSSIVEFIAAQQDQRFSYAEVGDSRGVAPRAYTADHNLVRLGYGAEAFARAKSAVRRWKMFDIPWVSLCWPDTPVEAGACVAVLVSHFGFWSLNACRIVYVIDEPDRFGFAYGTLADHAEIGEERFLVEFKSADQSVWYDLRAFSRPKTLGRMTYPLTRAVQNRFARDSKAAMTKAVHV